MSAAEKQHAAAVLTAVNAALSGATAYMADKVPSPRPSKYVELNVVRRFGGETRMPGRRGSTGWRITSRSVSQSSVNDARVLNEQVRAALEDVFLTINGETSTPVAFESAEPIGPDDGWFSGLSTWTYTH